MLDQEINQQLRAIKNKFIVRTNEILLKSGMTRIEFEILNFIYNANKNKDEVKASSLAKCFEVSIPAVMHKLDALESKRLINKHMDPKDKRIKYYRLTEETKMKYEELFARQEKRVSDYLRALGAEREHLIKILDITLQFLEDEYD